MPVVIVFVIVLALYFFRLKIYSLVTEYNKKRGTPEDLSTLGQVKKAVQADSYKDEAEKKSPKHIREEFFMSLVIALVPTFISIVLLIYINPDASAHLMLEWLIGSLVIFTALIFWFRQIAHKKFLKIIALVFIGALFIFSFFSNINTIIVCHIEGGTLDRYTNSLGRMWDIQGFELHQTGKGNGLVNNICYVSPEKTRSLLENKSFFTSFVTFVTKPW